MSLADKTAPTGPEAIERFLRNLQAETDGAFLYRALVAAEKDPAIAAVYRGMAASEERHAALWREKLAAAGWSGKAPRPSGRSRVLAWLAKRFGPRMVLATVVGMERADSGGYRDQPEAESAGLPAEEKQHGRLLGEILRGTTGKGLEGAQVATYERGHRAVGGNALRAAVLGANDGLVSNLSLVMGVAGANLPNQTILITGMAGLLAGAISMALGEWLSVQSSRELYLRQIAVERDELIADPEGETDELARIYRRKGLDPEQARAVAERLMADGEAALDTLAREELGVDPDELGGSAWEAALTSFALFSIGAIVPVLPFLFTSGMTAVGTSLAVSAAGLFGIGAAITLLTGRTVLSSGSRQTLFGLTAAAVTFGIGKLMGVAIAG